MKVWNADELRGFLELTEGGIMSAFIEVSRCGPVAREEKEDDMGDMVKALIFAAVAFVFFTFPSTWLLMLFFGNIGMELSYVATLPLGVLSSVLLSGVLSRPW